VKASDAKKFMAQLEAWRSDLIDLSRRNRLLNLPLTGRGTVIEVVEPDYIEVLDRLQDATTPGWRFHYPPPTAAEKENDAALVQAMLSEDPDPSPERESDELLTTVTTASLLSTKLRTISDKASGEFLDKGLRVLYLTVGMLHWNDGDPKGLSSPLVLIPVQLTRPSLREPFRLKDVGEDWTVNPALLVKLEKEFDVQLPDFDPDEIEAYFEEVQALVENRGWVVSRSIAVATLSFAKETIYRDLIENEKELAKSEVLQAITLAEDYRDQLDFDEIDPNSDDLDQRHPPETLNSILDADGTQMSCIVAAKQGASFVMDGPPGSGKSQTIANIIAELIGGGKTVLFVSEKAAALDVVKNRLDTAQLGDFVMELHSHKATRKAFAQELGDSLHRRVSLPMSKKINETRLRNHRLELTQYASAINEARDLTPQIRSLHDAIGRFGSLRDVDVAPVSKKLGSELDGTLFEKMMSLAGSLSRSWGPIEDGEDFLWRGITTETTNLPLAEIRNLLEAAIRELGMLHDEAIRISNALELETPEDLPGIDAVGVINNLLRAKPTFNREWLTGGKAKYLTEQVQRAAGQAIQVGNLAEALEAAGYDLQSLPADCDDFDRAVQACMAWIQNNPSQQQILAQSHASADMAVSSAHLLDTTRQAAQSLGRVRDDYTAAGAIRLRDLLSLGRETYLPPSDWLTPSGLVQAQNSFRTLEPLVREWQDMNTRFDAVFNANIAAFDIEAMFDGPSDVEPKLGRMSARGRKNRKQLAACTKTGKVKKNVTALIPEIRRWRNLGNQLNSHPDGVKLGHYFHGSATDLQAMQSALSVAERALALSDTDISPQQLMLAVSHDQRASFLVNDAAGELSEALNKWRNLATLPILTQQPSEAESLQAISQHHDAAARLLRLLADEMESFRVNASQGVIDAHQSAQRNTELVRLAAEVAAAGEDGHLDPYFAGLDTNWDELLEAIKWTDDIAEAIEGSIDDHVAEAIEHAEFNEQLSFVYQEYHDTIERILALFGPSQREFVLTLVRQDVDSTRRVLESLRDTTSGIAEWRDYSNSRTMLIDLGVGPVVELLEKNKHSRHEIVSVVEKSLLNAWIDLAIRTDERLHKGRRLDRDAVLAEFRELDKSLRLSSISKVLDSCSSRRPTSISGEFALISQQATIKRKHMPIRELLKHAGSAALDLKPCFMMSPLSVSQFLPPSLKFDCVIFDEASQVKPSDAVNALYRGKQAIIAGDERQLPPTSFFERTLSDDDDEYEEENLPIFESILGLSKSGLKQLPLRWHYRSRHESLISFSNREFYKSELITYPGAIETSEDLGVHFEHVRDGVYARGEGSHNVVEARRVVDRVIHHAQRHPHLSVGVVALSDAQASRIAVELEAVRRTRPDLDPYFAENRLDGFFVKNLESVQGDERDIIIFSIGYGKDVYGKLTMNFGPVGKDGGERRLNVAATRARQRVEVVSSIRAADFPEISNPRLLSFKRYLDYAERGVKAFADDGTHGGEAESPFEQDVHSVIQQLGYVPRLQVGQAGYRIDIGVVHPNEPGRYAIGIECDGATYHSSRVARDRDRLRQEVLEGLGWKIHRIWSTSWFTDRRAEIERLRAAIDAAVRNERGAASRTSTLSIPSAAVQTIEEEVAPWADIYRPSLTGVKKVSSFEDVKSASDIKYQLKQIVERLSPAHIEQIEVAVRAVQGFNVMSPARKSIVSSALSSLTRNKTLVKDRHGFYWLPEQTEVIVRRGDPDDPATVRRPQHVCPDEMKVAIFYLVKDARSIEREDLVTAVARLFGWQRARSAAREAIESPLRELVRAGDLTEIDGTRITAGDRETITLL
jgi:hypothetical protein